MMIDQIARRVRIIRRIYLGLVCVSTLSPIYQFVNRLKNQSPEEAGNALIFVLIYSAAYVGLKTARHWVIPLLLITSIWVLVQTLSAILEPASNVATFAAKMIHFVVLFFYWYQAFFFSRQEVKRYFNASGTILF